MFGKDYFCRKILPALEKISHSKWIQQLFPSCIWNLKNPEEKILYLTFDDGPIAEITPWVLNELNKFNAKATFFCVGANIEKNRNIFDTVLAQGHAVGNHTYTHRNGWKTRYKQYLSDTEACESLVKSNLFRPPYGKLKPLQLRALKSKFKIIMWSYLTGDYLRKLDKEKVLEEMKVKVVSGDIIVFHDSLKAEKNMKFLLPRVLEYFSNIGYSFKAINL